MRTRNKRKLLAKIYDLRRSLNWTLYRMHTFCEATNGTKLVQCTDAQLEVMIDEMRKRVLPHQDVKISKRAALLTALDSAYLDFCKKTSMTPDGEALDTFARNKYGKPIGQLNDDQIEAIIEVIG